MNEFILHFDTDHHALSSASLEKTLSATNKLLAAYSAKLDISPAEVTLEIEALSEGGFTVKGVIITGAMSIGGIITFIDNTSFGQAVFYRAFGVEYLEFVDRIKGDPDTTLPALMSNLLTHTLEEDEERIQEYYSKDELDYDTLEARSEFFQALAEDLKVKGLGFDHSHDFPIKRVDFVKRSQRPQRKQELEDLQWRHGETTIRVHHPNWDRLDQQKANWRGRAKIGDANPRVSFTVSDPMFWDKVEQNILQSTTGEDQLSVQWIYKLNKEKPKSCRVLRVLEFNGEIISARLTQEELETFIQELVLQENGRLL